MTPRPPRALYVHVPFCLSVCPYCDFVVVAGRLARRGAGGAIDAFVAAVHTELDLRADALDERFGAGRPALASVYLGGGTPSLLGVAQIADLLAHVDRRLGIATDAEVTIEANPGEPDRGDPAGFRAAGVNRLSLGVQSLVAGELRRLGRRHSAGDVGAAVRAARGARFHNISLDLLYDVPEQTMASWQQSLDMALEFAPDHISAYALTLDDPDREGLTGALGDHLPGRPGALRWRMQARAEQDEDRAAEQYELCESRLAGAGFERYELSNWAHPGHESRHNLAYWHREPVEAVGPGAHSFDGDRERRWNAASLAAYMAALAPAHGTAPRLPPGGVERLDAATAKAESLMVGLRLAEGIDAAWLADRDAGDVLAWGMALALLARQADRLRLTARGRLLGGELFARLLPDITPAAA